MDLLEIEENFQKAAGEAAFEQILRPTRPATLFVVNMQKTASADLKLLEVASILNPADPFSAYESLGGTYMKENV